jgi:hypothetical protein
VSSAKSSACARARRASDAGVRSTPRPVFRREGSPLPGERGKGREGPWLAAGEVLRQNSSEVLSPGPSCYPSAARGPRREMTYAEEAAETNGPISEGGPKGTSGLNGHVPSPPPKPSAVVPHNRTITSRSWAAVQRPVRRRQRSTANWRAAATTARLRARLLVATRSRCSGG